MPLWLIFTLTILASILATIVVEVVILTARHWQVPWRVPDRNPIARRLRHPSLGILTGKYCTF